MPRRAFFAAPLVLALLAACGGSDAPMSIPVTCGATANGGPLTINALAYTCGTATLPTTNVYTFSGVASLQYTVTLVTTSGDADLCVWVQGGAFIDCSIHFPPAADVVTFTAAATTTYEVEVTDASFSAPYISTYGVRVTSP